MAIGNYIGIGSQSGGVSFPATLTDGTCSFRQVIRGDYLCTDVTLTALGFAGVENTDWECKESVSSYWITQLSPEYKLVYDAMVTKPQKVVAEAQDIFVKTIVDSGFLAKMDFFYLFSQTGITDEALINIKNPGTFNGNAILNPLQVKLQGYLGNGLTTYIKTNYNPALNGSNYLLNSASLGAGSISPRQKGNQNIISAYDGTTFSQIGNRWSDNKCYWIINGAIANIDSVASTSAVGNWIASRTANNVCNLYKNKTKTAGSKLSTAVTDKEIYLLCRNDNGTPAYYAEDELNYAFAGGGLSDADVNAFNDAINTYKATVLLLLPKTPTGVLTSGTIHVDYINGVYRFGWDVNNIFYSSDSGGTWTTRAFAGADNIESSIIFSNGNVWFSRLNKSYKSLDGLATAPSEVTTIDKDGNNWTAQNNLGQTNAQFFAKSTSIDIVDLSGNEVAIWSNYANVIIAHDDCPINIFAMHDDCVPKIQYIFGINPSYPDAGDSLNAVICRHGHNACCDTLNNKWYLTTGDLVGANPWLIGEYNIVNKTSTWSVIANSPPILKNTNFASINYMNGYLYFATDDIYGIMYKSRVEDIEDDSKRTTLFQANRLVYNAKMQSDGVCVAVGLGVIFISQNYFETIAPIILEAYTGDFLKIDKVTDDNYKVEKYTPSSGLYYHNNSLYVAITKT